MHPLRGHRKESRISPEFGKTAEAAGEAEEQRRRMPVQEVAETLRRQTPGREALEMPILLPKDKLGHVDVETPEPTREQPGGSVADNGVVRLYLPTGSRWRHSGMWAAVFLTDYRCSHGLPIW